MVYGTYNYSYNYSYWGLFKPTYNWGAPHCRDFPDSKFELLVKTKPLGDTITFGNTTLDEIKPVLKDSDDENDGGSSGCMGTVGDMLC